MNPDPIPPVDRSRSELTDGSPVPEDGSHADLGPDGLQRGYVVLTAEERVKGFVRPVRRSYRHVGSVGPRNLRDLTADERERHGGFGYVAYEAYPGPDSSVVGRFWTRAQLDRVGRGCGAVTTMGFALAETYARDPTFYSGTFCTHCKAHFPVGPLGEFAWEGTEERVGT